MFYSKMVLNFVINKEQFYRLKDIRDRSFKSVESTTGYAGLGNIRIAFDV